MKQLQGAFGVRYLATGQVVAWKGLPLSFGSLEAAWDVANRMTLAALLAGRFGNGFIAVHF